MRATASAISFSPMISGGSSRTTLSPAATVIIFSSRSSSTISDAGGTMRRPISRPSPRTSAITDAWRSLSSASRCLSSERILPHPVEEAVRRDHVEHGIADRHRQRIAAEGRAVGAGGHALGRFRRRQAGADRKAAAERLGQRHDVGRDAGVLIGEQVAGAADAGLDLVEDQQQPVVVAQLAQGAQERVRHHPHAALAHDRLDQDGGGLPARSPSWSLRDRRTAPGRSPRPAGRSLRDISCSRSRRSRPACGRGRRLRR